MSRRNCCVFGCSNSYKNTTAQGRVVHFYKFPKYAWMKDRRDQWIRFVKRKTPDGKPWTPTKNSVLCSDHFIGGEKSEDPRNPSYNPTIFCKSRPEFRTQCRARFERYNSRQCIREPKESNVDQTLSTLPVVEPSSISMSTICSIPMDTNSLQKTDDLHDNLKAADTQTSPTPQPLEMINKICGPNHRTVCFGGFSTLNSSGRIREICGVSNNVFSLLLNFFPNHSNQYNELTIEDKLVMTLFKLKSGLPFTSIAAIFGVPYQTVSKSFVNIVSHIAGVTRRWIFLPSQHAIKRTLPEAFKEKYSNCRVIIDCTEMRTETPSSVEAKVHLYSNYKSGYTAKYLIGITPNGFIGFISKGYGGRSTDSFITNDCGILEMLEDGDIILADKGFPNVRVKEGTLLVMPPFSIRNQSQFHKEQMEDTYSIARVRIHVERAIQRIKIFEILTRTIPIELLAKLDDVVHVCGVLVNLSNPILK